MIEVSFATYLFGCLVSVMAIFRLLAVDLPEYIKGRKPEKFDISCPYCGATHVVERTINDDGVTTIVNSEKGKKECKLQRSCS